MSIQQIERQLTDWVMARRGPKETLVIEATTDLRELGLIDSLGFIGLMALLEELGADNIDSVLAEPKKYASIRELVSACFKGRT
jgi:hypothetical protein